MPKRKIHKSKLSIIDFQKKFSSEDQCREFLFELRFPQGFVCPECGCTEYYHIKKRHTYQCKCCRHQTSVTSGTVMDKTHLKLTYWLWAMFLFANDKRGCSASYLSQTLKLPYKTAWFLLQRLRSAMSNRESKYLLDGIVELDDTYIGTSDHGKKRGRGTSKMKIMVAVSKTINGAPKYVKMKVLPDLRGVTIGKFAKKNIAEFSRVETDNYRSLRKPLAEKYFHSYETFAPDKNMLKWLHTIISNAKAFVEGTYHGMERKHIQLYLDEFCYRFNRRSYHENLFERLALACVNCPECRLEGLLR